MNNSKFFARRSHTIDVNKQNVKKNANIPNNTIKASKRKPKLMPNNKIMQKLFPNFQTIDHERPTEYQKVEPITFRKQEGSQNEEKIFRELFEKQRQKYQAIFDKYMIIERPSRSEIKEFLANRKSNTLQTYRL